MTDKSDGVQIPLTDQVIDYLVAQMTPAQLRPALGRALREIRDYPGYVAGLEAEVAALTAAARWWPITDDFPALDERVLIGHYGGA